MKLKKVICILGPTATGKTKLAMELCKSFPADIVSVDSAMVFRGMNIGTAKPAKEELEVVPHRLINLLDPAESYSAGQFCQDATKEIKSIFEKNRTPILVGGTMLYFSLLQKGFMKFPDQDIKIREKLKKRGEEEGWEVLHKELERVDPAAAKKIHPNDPQRIQRALELYYSTGKTRSVLQENQVWEKLPYQFINIILAPPDRKILHERIEKRFDQMLEQGFVNEVKALYERGDLNENLPSIRSVGYRQVWKYLQNEYDYETMRYKGVVATRQLAKRQFTWLKQFEGKHFDSEQADLLGQVLGYLNQFVIH